MRNATKTLFRDRPFPSEIGKSGCNHRVKIGNSKHMIDRSSGIFWGAIAFLFACSLFYAGGARMEIQKIRSGSGKIENGSIVNFVKAIDGDTVVLVQEGQKPATVRVLGIKSFDTKIEKDVVTQYGQSAKESVERLMANRPVRVMLNGTSKDRFDRYIATLYVNNQDIGLYLIREGLALTYPVYPFPAMSLYLQEQELARAKRRGLWSNDDVTARALALMDEWQRRTE